MSRAGTSPPFGRVACVVVLATLLQLVPVTLPGLQPLALGVFVLMPLVLLLPMTWGLLAAIVPFAVTVLSLGHPLELVLGMLEVLWLYLILRWKRTFAPAVGLLFWLLIGLPLAAMFRVVLEAQPVFLVSLNVATQLATHVLAVGVADLLARYTPLGPWLGGVKRGEPRVRPLLFHLVLWLALVPLMAVGLGVASGLSSYVREQDRFELADAAARVSQQLEQFFEHHRAVLEHMAGVIAVNGADVPPLIETAQRTHPEFSTLLVSSESGAIRFAVPAGGWERGPRPPAEMELFRMVRADRAPVISGVLPRRRGSSDPILRIAVPVLDVRGEFRGTVKGGIASEFFEQLVAGDFALRGYELILVGRDAQVIVADTRVGAPPGTRVTHLPEAALLAAPAGSRVEFEKINGDGRRVPYVGLAIRSAESATTVIAQRPAMQAWQSLAWIVWEFAAVIFVVVVAAALAANAARRRLSRPLEVFAAAATRQAELRQVEPVPAPPAEAPLEVALVYRAFNQLASELQAAYGYLRAHNMALDQKIAERTRELELARSAAEASSRNKGEFLTMASHEIRTPLNVIINLATALRDGIRDPEARQRLDTIRGAGGRLLEVVNDVLDLSRIDAGRLEVHLAPVELGALLGEVEQMFRLSAVEKGLELRIEVHAPRPCWFEGDALRLLQILTNLVGNALKFTSRGSVAVRVDGTELGADVELRFAVIDSGPGIAPEFQASLFQPYVQVPGTRAVGTGLGIPISSRLVQLLGGQLELRSEPGLGTQFHFTLRAPRLAPPAPANPAPARTAELDTPRVLAVDDNVANQEVLRLILEPVCSRLEIVGSGAEALERLRQETFDVALIDLEMPVDDGYSVARALRQTPDRPNPHCRLVATSAYTQADVWSRCAESGFDAFIAKPIVREQLLELVAQACPTRT